MSSVPSPFDPDHDPVNDAYVPDLSEFDADYAVAEPTKFTEVPDGSYQVRVQSVRLDRSRKGDHMLKWDLVILSGQFAGRHIFKNAVIKQTTLKFVKADLTCVGIALDKMSDVQAHLAVALDKTLEVRKKTRGDFTDVYFERLITLPPGIADPSPPSGSDIPF